MPSIEQLGSKYSYFDSEINSWVQSKDRTDDWLRVDEVAPGLTHEQASERGSYNHQYSNQVRWSASSMDAVRDLEISKRTAFEPGGGIQFDLERRDGWRIRE
ncbi:MAG: hypothetical protein MMC23_001886 [Stictis urceolatum]|nr:hypothetical protein [Stictis urceolata]